MKSKGLIRVTPYLIVCIILIYTWYIIITTDYYATLKHQIGAAVAILNLIVYFIRFKYGIFLTGILLLLATFNLVGFFPEIVYSSYFIKMGEKEIASPSIQGKSLLLLVLYFIMNIGYFIELYSGYRYHKSNSD